RARAARAGPRARGGDHRGARGRQPPDPLARRAAPWRGGLPPAARAGGRPFPPPVPRRRRSPGRRAHPHRPVERARRRRRARRAARPLVRPADPARPGSARRVMAAPLALPDAFWDQLARSHWERAPLVFRAPGGRALATLDEVFAGLVAAADRYRQLDGGVRLRLFLDGALAQHDIVSLLPAREDGSIAGYAARLDRALDGREYLLVINNLQRHLPGLHRRLCGFLAPLYRRVGMPAGLADADVFVGRYSRTPFGVHKDDASNFQFILEGDKTMRVWPDQAFGDPAAMWEDASHVRDAEYERARARGEVLRGRPGDVLYWPSSHWHVGES